MRRASAIAVLIAGIAAIAQSTGPADAKRKIVRPHIVVRPDAPAPYGSHIDWYDELRWRPLTAAEIDASRHVVRRCTDWFALEPRPSGTVLTPHMRCWWVVVR